MMAAAAGDVQLMRELLDNNADIEAATSTGATALHFAILYRKMESVVFLVNYTGF